MKSVELNAPVAENGRKRQIGFYVAASIFILLFAGMLIFVVPVLPLAITGWFSAEALGAHQIHDTLAAILLWTILLGVVGQAVQPRRQIGGMQQAVAVLVGLNAAILLGDFSFPPMLIFLALGVVTAVLHPAGRGLRPRFERASRSLLALTLLAAVPLVAYAAGQIGLQRLGVPNDTHAEIGHWVIMGGYAISIVLLGVLASLRPSGWRLPTWSAGALAILLGLASLLLHGASALTPLWSAGAIVWGLLFIAVAERTREGSVGFK